MQSTGIGGPERGGRARRAGPSWAFGARSGWGPARRSTRASEPGDAIVAEARSPATGSVRWPPVAAARPALTAALAMAAPARGNGRLHRPLLRPRRGRREDWRAAGRGGDRPQRRRRRSRSARRSGVATACALVVRGDFAAGGSRGRCPRRALELGRCARRRSRGSGAPVGRGVARLTGRCQRSAATSSREVVELVLDRLETGRERAESLLEPLDVGGRPRG